MATGVLLPDPFQAGCFLYDHASHSVLLHKRDGKTPVNPHKWAFFGGRGLPGETDVDCCVRELREEIGLRVQGSDLKRLRSYMNHDHNLYRVVFYLERRVELDQLVLGEGAGFAWIDLAKIDDMDLTQATRADIRYFLQHALE